MLNLLKLTFLDKDGGIAIPEVVAAIGACSGLGATLWDFLGRGAHFDLQGFGIGLGSIVLAMATAQRVRDGLWKEDR